jgi:hypothetical protein
MALSTATLERLPDIETLRRLTKSIALLDAILCPVWEDRYYSYNSEWGESEEMASMRNGAGDEWFLLFGPNGAALKGYAHEYPLAQDASFAASIQKAVPSDFASFLNEAAFSMNNATFCLWRRVGDTRWNAVSQGKGTSSPDDDGSADLIGILDGNPETYRSFAIDYYEREIPLAAVETIYRHQALDEKLVSVLNPETEFSAATDEAAAIGYPV